MLGFIYAGQGSQFVGMGSDLYEAQPAFRNIFDMLPKNLRTLAFEGPIEELSNTKNTQPCMVAFAAGVTAVLKEHGIVPSMAAGLSLGEYSALVCGGVFTPIQAIELVAFRGRAMMEAAKGIDSGMAAVMGLSRELLALCCAEASEIGIVSIANYNCPNQLVIAGEAAAVDRASQLAREKGAKRCIPLQVSGPFHTKLMRSAGEALEQRLAGESLGEMKLPVVFNCTAKELSESESIKSLLKRQVYSSVYFEDSIRYMINSGVSSFVEIGPGKVLSGFVKKIDPSVQIYNVNSCENLTSTLSSIGKKV